MLSDLYAGALADTKKRQETVTVAELEKLIAGREPALNALDFLAPAEHMRVIAEVKRASPSKGDLADIPEPQQLAQQYEAGGAAAISVLTEERKFKGCLQDLEDVRRAVEVPILRKDFLASEYQLLEARAYGADIALLIVAGLEQPLLQHLYDFATDLGLSCLVEAHTGEEVARAVDLGAEIIGVNARNLDTFELDRDLFGQVADRIPAGVIRVAESAVLTTDDVQYYRDAGADAVLVGEALVKDGDPAQAVARFSAIH